MLNKKFFSLYTGLNFAPPLLQILDFTAKISVTFLSMIMHCHTLLPLFNFNAIFFKVPQLCLCDCCGTHSIPSFCPCINYRAHQGRKEMFYLMTHSTHFIYGYMASAIWLRTILIVREETRCRHIGYSFRLAARVLLYAPSHRQDSTHHSLCYTSRGALAGTRNSSMGPPWRIDPTTMSEHSYHEATSRSKNVQKLIPFV